MTDGKNTLEITVNDQQMKVTLKPNQYKQMDNAFIQTLLQPDNLLLPGQIVQNDSSNLILSYTLPKFAQPLLQASKNAAYTDRLRLAIMLSSLAPWQNNNINLFMAPENIVVIDGQIKLAYRGFEKLLAPADMNADEFLLRYKALVVTTINPKYKYAALIDGSRAINDQFEKSIMEATDINAVTEIIQDRHQRLTMDLTSVKKKRYIALKWSASILAIATIGLGSGLFYLSGIKEPEQERIINSQAAFMTKDYNKTTDILKDDNPKKLSKSAQYVLANSYINLDNLTNKQKTTLLNNISPQSDTNTLLYWIYSGKGNFKEALSLAKNLGDNQLTLYAYTKLYDVTKADNKMAGSKKQELLSRYQKSINQYVKKLGGKADGIEK